MRDKDGNLVIKNGKVQPDITLQDTENIPLSEEIIADKNKQLEILDQYKKSLIYEYVTGKKEVPQEKQA